jgi:uncharacterized protein YciI
MQFHVKLVDAPGTQEIRQGGGEAHWQYLDDNAEHIMGRGPTYTPDMSSFSSTLFFLDFENWEAVREFIDNEPHNINQVYSEVSIRRWENISGRFQREFPRYDDQVNWYLRGFAKPNTHGKWLNLKSEYIEFTAKYDMKNIVEGTKWSGGASLMSMPTREEIDEFLHNDPLYKNGLYEKFSVERFKFGGRPGQIT